MAWMFRWLSAFFARFRGDSLSESGWVEPSNAITRAILTGHVPELPAAAAGAEPAAVEREPLTLPQRSPQVTRTAQRTRRRRAGRAA